MSLSNPNPFYKRMEERDPKLFVSDVDGKFNAYSRICPWNVRRQPVILTDEEKNNIDKNHPGSYDEAIKYGTSKDKEFWYICPRYWSLKDNTSLTEEQVKSGKYGNIIPEGAKKIPPGANIFEFTDNKYHKDKQDNYVKHYPGFVKEGSHPDGYCLPCCFKAWNSPEQNKRREQCIDKKVFSDKKDVGEDYIIGNDKFPIDNNRWGYLPIAIQKFLKVDNKKCQISISNTNLKPNHLCMLRQGVEFNKTQSFISVIANLYNDINSRENISIRNMKKILLNALNIDIFITLQNGSLINSFKDDKKITSENIDKYKESKIYKNIDFTNIEHKEFFNNVVNSYENYINFINDDEIVIDYTYLWDLICKPNPNLFIDGLNMVIIEMNNDDITNNVRIICPTNHYSSEFFDINKNTLLIIKNDNYYEPIYSVEDKIKTFSVSKVFNFKNTKLQINIRNTLEFIKNSLNKYCGLYPSLPKVYNFKKNILLPEMVTILKTYKYEITKQVLNYNGKVVGIIVKNNIGSGYIPCLPSNLIVDFKETTWIDDDIWDTYENTISFLLEVYNNTKNKIPCKPMMKVIDDGLIVGILTETNQFISIKEPVQDTFGEDLIVVNNSNYIEADVKSILSNKKDHDRIEYIKNIKLETGFYNTFRNTVRILLGLYNHRKIRGEIEELCNNKPYLLYSEKLLLINKKLRELTSNSIQFILYNKELINKIENIANCIVKDENKCKQNNYCMITSDKTCKLLIPKNNIINNSDNEKIYYNKLSDELIRYNRINQFIFKTNSFLSFTNIKYNLNDDEIILLQSLLTQEYFENIEIQKNNPYVKHNTYDTVNPDVSQKYSNIIDLKSYKNKQKCLIGEKDVEKNISKYLPSNSKELIYNRSNNCSFQIILDIIESNDSSKKFDSVNSLKEELLSEYTKIITNENMYNFYNILGDQGKQTLFKKILLGESKFENVIMSESYSLSSMDIWVLAIKYNLPIILISETDFTENKKKFFILNNPVNKYVYFINYINSTSENVIPECRLIKALNNIKIEITLLPNTISDNIKINKPVNIDKYIDNYKKVTEKRKIKLKIKSKDALKDEPEEDKVEDKKILIKIKKSSQENRKTKSE